MRSSRAPFRGACPKKNRPGTPSVTGRFRHWLPLDRGDQVFVQRSTPPVIPSSSLLLPYMITSHPGDRVILPAFFTSPTRPPEACVPHQRHRGRRTNPSWDSTTRHDLEGNHDGGSDMEKGPLRNTLASPFLAGDHHVPGEPSVSLPSVARLSGPWPHPWLCVPASRRVCPYREGVSALAGLLGEQLICQEGASGEGLVQNRLWIHGAIRGPWRSGLELDARGRSGFLTGHGQKCPTDGKGLSRGVATAAPAAMNQGRPFLRHFGSRRREAGRGKALWGGAAARILERNHN